MNFRLSPQGGASSTKKHFQILQSLLTCPHSKGFDALANNSLREFKGTQAELFKLITDARVFVETGIQKDEQGRSTKNIVVKSDRKYGYIRVFDNRFRNTIETPDGPLLNEPIIIRFPLKPDRITLTIRRVKALAAKLRT